MDVFALDQRGNENVTQDQWNDVTRAELMYCFNEKRTKRRKKKYTVSHIHTKRYASTETIENGFEKQK